MKSSAFKEIIVFFATIVCGLLAVYVYQNHSYLGEKIRALTLDHSEPSGAERETQKNSGEEIDIKGLSQGSGAQKSEVSGPLNANLGGGSAVDVSILESQRPPSAFAENSVVSTQDARPEYSDDALQLRLAIKVHMEERRIGRWTNPGLTLWRSCSKFIRDNKNSEIPYELVSACRDLLSDAILGLRGSVATGSAQEVMEIAKEMRNEKLIVSPAERLELDKLSQLARSVISSRKPKEVPALSKDRSNPSAFSPDVLNDKPILNPNAR